MICGRLHCDPISTYHLLSNLVCINLSALPLHFLSFHLIIHGDCNTIFPLSASFPPTQRKTTSPPGILGLDTPGANVLGDTPCSFSPITGLPLRATTVSGYALKSNKTTGLVVYCSSETRHLFLKLGHLNLSIHCLQESAPFVTTYPAPRNFPPQSAGHCRSPTICYSYLDSTIDWRAALRTSWLAILLEIEIALQRHPQNLLYDLRHPAP